MSNDGQWPLCTAIYQLLSQDSGIEAALQGDGSSAIYLQRADDAANYPYIVIQLAEVKPLDTKTHKTLSANVNVNVLTERSSPKEAIEIGKEINRVLQNADFVMDDYQVVDHRFLSAVITPDVKRNTTAYGVRYAFIIEPK